MAANIRDSFLQTLETLKSESMSLDDKKIKLLNEKVRDIIKYKASLAELDMDLQSYIKDSENDHVAVFGDKEIQLRLNDISPDSLIIYVKKAQLYKIYHPDGMEEFIHDESTHYHKPQYGPVYEVIRDIHPQKLMIVIADDIRDDQLITIKQHIVDFINTEPTLINDNLSDMKVYSNDNNTEFVVSSVLLQNMSEKEIFIERFIRFMQYKGEIDLASKIQLRLPPCMIEGARMTKIPSIKTSLSGTMTDVVAELVTNSKQTPVIINQTFIINSNVNSNINSNVNSNNIVHTLNNTSFEKPNTRKTLKTFYKFLYDTKPNWYKGGTYVPLKTLEDSYREFFNDKTTSASAVSKKISDLFISSTRVNNVTKKKLVTYETLKKLF